MDPHWGEAVRCPSLGNIYLPMGSTVLFNSTSGKDVGRLIELSELDDSQVKIRLYRSVEDDENVPPELKTRAGDDNLECCQGINEVHADNKTAWVEDIAICEIAFVFTAKYLIENPSYRCRGVSNAYLLRLQRGNQGFSRADELDFAPFPSDNYPEVISIDYCLQCFKLTRTICIEMVRAMSSATESQGDFCIRRRSVRFSCSEWEYIRRRLRAEGLVLQHCTATRRVPILKWGLTYESVPDQRTLDCFRMDSNSKVSALRSVFGSMCLVGIRVGRLLKNSDYVHRLNYKDVANVITVADDDQVPIVTESDPFKRSGIYSHGADLIFDGGNLTIILRYGRQIVQQSSLDMFSTFGVQEASVASETSLQSFEFREGMECEQEGFGWKVKSVANGVVVVEKYIDKRSVPNVRLSVRQEETRSTDNELRELRAQILDFYDLDQ